MNKFKFGGDIGQNIFSSKKERYKKMLMFIFNDEDSGKRRKQLCLDNGLTIPRGLQKKCFKKNVQTIPVQQTENCGNTAILREVNIVDTPITLICQAST